MPDSDRFEGKAKEMGGTIQQKAGQATDNPDMEGKGEAKREEGKAQGTWGKVKDTAGDVADTAKEKVKGHN